MNFNDWVSQLLQFIGAPNTSENQQFLQNWFNREGPDMGFNNPLNITKAYAPCGSVGQGGSQGNIQKFGSVQCSAQNTGAFLLNGYSNIVNALRSGNPWNANNSGGLASELLPWSGNGYSSIPGGSTTNQNLGQALFPLAQNPFQAKDPRTGKTPLQSIGDIFTSPIQGWISEGVVAIGAITFIFIGALWIILGNKGSQQIAIKMAKDAVLK